MGWFITLNLVLGLGRTLASAEILTPGDFTRSLSFGGLDRNYLVHIPPSCDAGKPSAVVLVFHGGAANAQMWIPFCGLNETADKNHFITVYPNGTGRIVEGYGIFGWNGGPHRPGGEKPELNKIDDVGFTHAVLDDLEKVCNVDPKRVFATGMSMGGIMVYRVASELSERIAAIAPISGSMGTETCEPKQPVSVLHFHGTQDPAVPIEGGKGKLDSSGAIYLSADHSVAAWAKADACDPVPKMESLPNPADNGTTVTRKIYGAGKDDAEVILVTIHGGGHAWPGREFGPEMAILGKSTKDISANDMMWEFFKKHPKP